jgi:hypothetical protein
LPPAVENEIHVQYHPDMRTDAVLLPGALPARELTAQRASDAPLPSWLAPIAVPRKYLDPSERRRLPLTEQRATPLSAAHQAALDEVVRRFLRRAPLGLIAHYTHQPGARFSRLDNGELSWIDVVPPGCARPVPTMPSMPTLPPERHRVIVRPLADPGWFAELGWTEGRSLLLVFDEAPARALRRTLLSFAQAFPAAEAAFAFVRPGLFGRAAAHLVPELSATLPVAGARGAATWHRDLVALDEVDCLSAVPGPLRWLGALHRTLTGEPLVGVARLGVGWASRRGAATPRDLLQPRSSIP